MDPHQDETHPSPIRRYRHLLTLATLLVVISLMPFADSHQWMGHGAMLILTLVVIPGVFGIIANRRARNTALAMGIPILLLSASVAQFTAHDLEVFYFLAVGLFLAFTVAAMTWNLLRAHHVSAETVSAAIAVYLMIGVLWAVIFEILILVLGPDSMTGLAFNDRRVPVFSDLIYFSFTTLTTLGYGDIVPTHPVVKSAAITEAVIGQVFLVVAIARVVGMYVAAASASDVVARARLRSEEESVD